MQAQQSMLDTRSSATAAPRQAPQSMCGKVAGKTFVHNVDEHLL